MICSKHTKFKVFIKESERITFDQVVVEAKSDDVRQAEIRQDGKHIGAGNPYDHNACCADSILQLMSVFGMVDGELYEDVLRSRTACEEARAWLNKHENERLHPKWLTELGAIDTCRTDAEHYNAYLQHDLHGPALVSFFLTLLSYSTRCAKSTITSSRATSSPHTSACLRFTPPTFPEETKDSHDEVFRL